MKPLGYAVVIVQLLHLTVTELGNPLMPTCCNDFLLENNLFLPGEGGPSQLSVLIIPGS